MADSECAQRLWVALIGKNPSKYNNNDENPTEMVSWQDVQQFNEIASRMAHVPVTLPTEAEWEYACRAGTTTRYSFGDDPELLVQYGNVADQALKAQWKLIPGYPFIKGDDGFSVTAPVKSFKPNPWGLYDMHGNVWQWCQDIELTKLTANDDRIVRGGSWGDIAPNCRSASRNKHPLDFRSPNLGFRFIIPNNAAVPVH
jgi:formylglycine-generating enzyme required for sulfatase activity